MTNSQPPLSPNSAIGTPASPVPKHSAFRPIDAAPAGHSQNPYSPQPYAPPLSPASPYSSNSSTTAPWSPGTVSTTSSAPYSPPLETTAPGTNPQPRRYNPNDEGIQDLFIERSHTEHYRLQGAKHRSLALLDEYIETGDSAQQVTPRAVGLSANRMNLRQAKEFSKEQASETGKDLTWNYEDAKDETGTHQGSKGFIDRNVTEEVRLHGAKQRSLALLETYAESVKRPGTDADSAYTAKLKSIPREDEIYDNQKTSRRKNMHMMASSTRKKKPLKPEDVRDPETVAGMKNQLDLDREKAAEKKALLLLDIMAMF